MFKVTETKKIIPPEDAYEVQVKVFTCAAPGCSFKLDDDYFGDDPVEKMKRHYGREHAVKKKREIGKQTLLWFDSKEDAEAYQLGLTSDEYTDLNRRDVYFDSPGWYVIHAYSEVGRCRCGKCHDFFEDLRPASWWLETQRAQVASLYEKASKLRSEAEALIAQINTVSREVNPQPEED